jgi:triosephosphate isomerase
MRKPFIAANWKMNKTVGETREFLSVLIPAVKDVQHVTIAIAPPFTSLAEAAGLLRNTSIVLAAQNVFFEAKGAYTGEISPVMLADIGCGFCIVGHSERRQYFFETDDVVNKKIKAARGQRLGVIFCIGESLAERDAGDTFSVLGRQLERGLGGVSPDNLVIAYEPVWAIGTGKTATPDEAQEAHAFIRENLRHFYGEKSEQLCIIYGGSVTPDNVDSLMSCRDVDGALVGGASLKAESFIRIVRFEKKP